MLWTIALWVSIHACSTTPTFISSPLHTGWNVMLSSSGTTAHRGGRGWVAKVADFGLARALELQSRITTRNYGASRPCGLLYVALLL